MKGIFIAIEGPDGCGKSTQIANLRSLLEKDKAEIVVTREPGGTPLGEAIRTLLLTPSKEISICALSELLLFSAARAQHVENVIKPAIERGAIVIASRYTAATIAYQGYGRKINMPLIETLNQIATGGLQPDLTVIIDIESEIGLMRARNIDEETPSGEFDRIEAETLEFHRAVRTGYLEFAQKEKNCAVIDGTLSIEAITTEIMKRIELIRNK